MRGGWLVLLLAGVAGCSGGGGGTVSGEVTVDNVPLAEGRIEFTPPGPKGPLQTTITAGKYTLRDVPEGTALVRIFAPKMIGKKAMLPGSPPVEQYDETLPKRYNVESDLKREVKAGDNKIDFPIQGK